VDTLHKRFSKRFEQEVEQTPDSVFARINKAPQALSLSPRETKQSKVQKYVLGVDNQCAMTVHPAASTISGHLLRVYPYVHQQEDILLCFFGFLKNAKDLGERLDLTEELGLKQDVGELTTRLIVSLYKQLKKNHSSKIEELLLSELHGSYAFFLYDSQQKQGWAARDPSGDQGLYFHADSEDGSVAFTNSLEHLPSEEVQRGWKEVLPGHYVSPRSRSMKQFALTPEQLRAHIRYQSDDRRYALEDEYYSLSPSKPNFFTRLSQKLKA